MSLQQFAYRDGCFISSSPCGTVCVARITTTAFTFHAKSLSATANTIEPLLRGFCEHRSGCRTSGGITKARSGLPLGLMPAASAENRNPFGRWSLSGNLCSWRCRMIVLIAQNKQLTRFHDLHQRDAYAWVGINAVLGISPMYMATSSQLFRNGQATQSCISCPAVARAGRLGTQDV